MIKTKFISLYFVSLALTPPESRTERVEPFLLMLRASLCTRSGVNVRHGIELRPVKSLPGPRCRFVVATAAGMCMSLGPWMYHPHPPRSSLASSRTAALPLYCPSWAPSPPISIRLLHYSILYRSANGHGGAEDERNPSLRDDEPRRRRVLSCFLFHSFPGPHARPNFIPRSH